MELGMEGKGSTPSPNHEVDRPQTGGGPPGAAALALIRPVGGNTHPPRWLHHDFTPDSSRHEYICC